ncbi:OmpH family outer membrane protein [bacterium]|nr:MAG: OmpH family outer membrane protein [bacterium]
MKKTLQFVIPFIMLLVLTLSVKAQGVKVGYANPDVIIDKLPDFKKVQAELQNLAQKREAEVVAKRDSMGTFLQKYQQIAATLSPQQNEQEQMKLQAMNEELQELGNSARLELQRKQAELFQPLYEQVQLAIQDVAKELKLDFVFNSTTSNGDAIILFVDEAQKSKLDITEKVIAKITKK